MSTRTGRVAIVAMSVLIFACEGAATVTTDDLSLHSDGGICDLNTVVDGKQGVIVGRVVSVQTGFSGGLPWDVPGREYAIATVEVDEAMPPLLEPGTDGVWEPLAAGMSIEVVVYPDYEATPIEEVGELASAETPAILLLSAIRAWDQPELPGMWGLARAVSVDDDKAVFLGQCADLVNGDFLALAEALGREPDKDLVVDFAAETLATQNTPLAPGPIELKLLELRGMLPLPTLLPDPGPAEFTGVTTETDTTAVSDQP